MKKEPFSLVIVLLLFCSSSFVGCLQLDDPVDGVFASPNEAGVLIIEDGVRLLKLSGSPYEMGYAHGYLLAEEIIYLLDHFVFYSAFLFGASYEELVANMDLIDWEASYIEELQGMLAGIQDRLPPYQRMVHPNIVGKQIALVDLKIANTVSDWGCSSFSTWGNATDDGSVIYARNLDYFSGKDECFKKVHVLISYDDGVHHRWVTASVAGFIGCITGMNDAGLTLGLQDTNYFPPSVERGIIPRCLILRKIAEHADEDWTPDDIAEFMESFQGYLGMNLHVTFPTTNRSDDDIAGIIEFDGNSSHPDGRSTLRSPGENSGLPINDSVDQTLNHSFTLITTNHYLERKTDISLESAGRYVTIKEELYLARADGNVSIDEAVHIMRLVGGIGTVHTTVFETDEKRLHFYLAEPGSGGFDSPSVIYEFEEMF